MLAVVFLLFVVLRNYWYYHAYFFSNLLKTWKNIYINNSEFSIHHNKHLEQPDSLTQKSTHQCWPKWEQKPWLFLPYFYPNKSNRTLLYKSHFSTCGTKEYRFNSVSSLHEELPRQYVSLHEGVQIIFHDFHCHHLNTPGVRFWANIKTKNQLLV